MREEAFRSYLIERLRPNAVSSYLANLRAVERTLDIDLDVTQLDDDAIPGLRRRLLLQMPPARTRDCASALRQYAAFVAGVALPDRGRRDVVVGSRSSAVAPPRAAFIRDVTTGELMRLYADVLEELRDRGVTRTANGPVGDYAELLFARAFDWTLAGNSAAAYDATDQAGSRFQIKARRVGGSDARQLGDIRRLPEAGFDHLAAVLFDRDLQVLRAALIPYRIVAERARRAEHTNSWRFLLSDDVWGLPTVRDATDSLRDAASRV